MKVSGTYIAPNGVACNVECGFIPDEVLLIMAIGGTEIYFTWLRVMGDTSALTGQYGISDDAGAKTHATSASAGIIAYDAASNSILLPAPNGNGEEAADAPNPYTVTRSTNATARSATALGTVLKPSLGNETGFVYECTTAGTGSAEPDWNTIAGGVTADNDVRYITREEKVFQGQLKGFTVGSSLCTDGSIHAFTAMKHDRSADMGDGDNTNPVKFSS